MKTITIPSDSQREDENMYHRSLVQRVQKILSPNTKKIFLGIKLSTKTIKIFLVDDDPLYLKALEHSISKKFPSVQILTFTTGEACLEQMKLKPEVVILDYYLNSREANAMDGLTVLKGIKEQSSKTEVIMLSGQDSLEIAVKCSDNGSFDFITKSESAFTNINNELQNLIDEIELNNEALKPYQIISILVIVILIICLILN